MSHDTEEAFKKKEQEAEERRQQSHNMVADTIKRELLESASSGTTLIASLTQAILFLEEKEAEIPDVDDIDGLDPEAEFEAWRLRELARIKRDKEAEVQRELEREEIERRRALPEEQRLREDMENAKRTRDEKPKGQQKFLQKYWHKGAFYQVRYVPLQLPHRYDAYSRVIVGRMRRSSRNTISQKLPNLLWTFRCSLRLCKSKTLESVVAPSTPIW